MKYYILRTEVSKDSINKVEYLVEAKSKEEAIERLKANNYLTSNYIFSYPNLTGITFTQNENLWEVSTSSLKLHI